MIYNIRSSQFKLKQSVMTLRKVIGVCLFSSILVACSDNDDDTASVEETVSADIPVETRPATGPLSEACLEAEMVPSTTSKGVEFIRTPDACFDELPGYDFAANYLDIEGLRLHYVDEGPKDGEVVLMLHGQPSWSYLYRKMIPILAEAGYRVIALDNMGMGKSDKPLDVAAHQYEHHVAWTKTFINQLQLTDINLFVQDWGSLIGLRVAGNMSERFARIVVANGDMPIFPTGGNPFQLPDFNIDESLTMDASTFFDTRSTHPIEGFQQWIDYAATAPELMAGDVVQKLSAIELSDAEVNAYNAPYPNVQFKAAIRAFPSMLSGIEAQNLAAWQTLGAYHNPFMFNAGEYDKGLGSEANQSKWVNHVPGAKGVEHRRFQAAHFIQDDVGEDLALHLLAFMQTTAPQAPLVTGGANYNMRYCEILLPYMQDDKVIAQVWGTPGVNMCEQSQWEAIDFEEVAAQYDALSAIPNGPRFFVVDESRGGDVITQDADTQFRLFGELKMRLLTTADMSAAQGEQLPYVAGEVSRSNTWHFYKGRRIYELTDNTGQVFVMQSFSRISDASLQMDDLANLGDKLSLPEGWTFSSRILTEPLDVTAVEGIAYVLQDELGNSYQLRQ
ncbi:MULTISPECIES: haloalkane dehalogenase [unclassified Pseudoalteromonas]|uniref:haloalkane dehalogenase n=1 Tax=unclassified Pseudoalteromonas TaxID=194690 RepID=UPI002096BE0B|nr:haloalkane dehalogenase [Pseudoalteromonas sp. XMcav2-N]MCO7187194.1 haloalkane dehalogenase [Pseudoalteromonas sp. XMcav2-N]